MLIFFFSLKFLFFLTMMTYQDTSSSPLDIFLEN
jgi:hypothetical protein